MINNLACRDYRLQYQCVCKYVEANICIGLDGVAQRKLRHIRYVNLCQTAVSSSSSPKGLALQNLIGRPEDDLRIILMQRSKAALSSALV